MSGFRGTGSETQFELGSGRIFLQLSQLLFWNKKESIISCAFENGSVEERIGTFFRKLKSSFRKFDSSF